MVDLGLKLPSDASGNFLPLDSELLLLLIWISIAPTSESPLCSSTGGDRREIPDRVNDFCFLRPGRIRPRAAVTFSARQTPEGEEDSSGAHDCESGGRR